MKLATKVIAVFLLAVAALTAIQGYLVVRRERNVFREEHENSARRFTRAIENALIAALKNDQPDRVSDLLKERKPITNTTEVKWVDFHAVASIQDGKIGEIRLEDIQQGTVASYETQDGDSKTLHTYYALSTLPENQGGLQFSTPLDQLDQRNRNTMFQTLSLLIGMGVLSVLVILFAGVRLVGRPLEKLVQKTRRIGEGDLTAPIEFSSQDELGQLATALNEMCARLSQQQQDIQEESSARLATMQQLRHADRLKTVGRLAAGIAHEMGTPLNVVSGRAGLIASGKLSQDEIHDSALTIKSEAEHITVIIRQLLDFARRNTPLRGKADLRDIARQTVNLLESLSAKQNVRLVLKGDEQPMFAMIDSGQFQQVLTNLVMNAIHAMPNGGQVTIHLGQEQATPPDSLNDPPIRVYSISIADEGHGIAEEDLQHIFEPFFTTKDVGQGTGLGLSIAHGIIEEHEGWIDVQSQKPIGCRFTIYIPIETQVAASNGDAP